MATLIWHAPMRYRSPGDEAAFFAWLQAIPGVLGIAGVGTELHIAVRPTRLNRVALTELVALYRRYGGDMRELALFVTAANRSWLEPLLAKP